MKRTILTLLTAGMVSAAALTGTVAFAGPDAGEIAAFQKAAHGIEAAIKTAEQTTDGKAVEAEFEVKDGTGIWEIKTVAGTKHAEVKIDAGTGAVIKTKDKGDIADKTDAVTPEMLGAPLVDLVAKAEAEGGGKVIEIEFEHKDGKPVGIEVEIVKPDGSLHKFLMGADGKLTPLVKANSDEAEEN